MKKITLAVSIVLLIVLALATTVQASPPEYLYFVKDCDTEPCIIQDSNLEILNGGEISYYYHTLDEENFFLSAEVAIEVDGGSARGTFVFIGDHGYFTIQDGSGVLEGFHAQGKIGWIEGTWLFPMEGKYHFDP